MLCFSPPFLVHYVCWCRMARLLRSGNKTGAVLESCRFPQPRALSALAPRGVGTALSLVGWLCKQPRQAVTWNSQSNPPIHDPYSQLPPAKREEDSQACGGFSQRLSAGEGISDLSGNEAFSARRGGGGMAATLCFPTSLTGPPDKR